MQTHRTALFVNACIALFLYAITVVVMPICLLHMKEDLGFQLTGGGALELGRTALLLFMLLLSGWVAMRWGKVRPMAVGLYIVSAAFVLLSQCHSYTTAMLCIMLVGTGTGFLEALTNPLVEDLYPNDHGKHLNITNAFFSLGVMAGTLAMGEALMLGASWREIALVVAVLCFGAGCSFLLSAGAKLPPSPHSAYHITEILKKWRFWCFGLAMVCAGATEASYTFWSASYVQLHFDELPRAGAFATAIFAGAMTVGRLTCGRIAHRVGLRSMILFSAFLGAAIAVLPACVESVWMFYFSLVLAGLSVACFWPSIQAYAAATMEVDSTLLFIFLSCFGIPGFGGISLIMGIIGDAAGLQRSFLVVPVLFLLLAVGILLPGKPARRTAAPDIT